MNEQDKRVRDYYAKLSMPADKVDQLIFSGVADQSSAEHEKNTDHAATAAGAFDEHHDVYARKSSLVKQFVDGFSVPKWQTTFRAIAACAVVMMVSLWMHNTGTESERMQRTVSEVAMNHTTRLEPEYRGETLASLDNSMQQLPFALVLPKAIGTAYELVGSRYCSLGGALAAHVKFKEKDSGKHMSLFVTGNSDELEEIRAKQAIHEGVAVEFWREDGLFFALAQRT